MLPEQEPARPTPDGANNVRSNNNSAMHECDVCQRAFRFKHHMLAHRKAHRGAGGDGSSGRPTVSTDTMQSSSAKERDGRPVSPQTSAAGISMEEGASQPPTTSSAAGAVKPFECSECHKKFSLRQTLQRHFRIHTGEKLYECSYCPKKFAHSHSLKGHERSHTGVKPYECSYCPKKFAQSHSRKIHERFHTGVKPHECSYCPKKFAHPSSWKVHERSHTGVKPYECSYCRKKFAHAGSLQIHERTHSGEKPFKCPHCSFESTNGSNLRHHSRTHADEGPYRCSVCEKSFAASSALKLHTRTHTGEKPNHCSLSEESSTSSSNLRQPTRSHIRERLYACSRCSQRFTTLSKLKVHSRTHTEETIYECPECLIRFITANALKNHQRVHVSTKKPHECSECARRFSSTFALKRHMKTHQCLQANACSDSPQKREKPQHFGQGATIDSIKEEPQSTEVFSFPPSHELHGPAPDGNDGCAQVPDGNPIGRLSDFDLISNGVEVAPSHQETDNNDVTQPGFTEWVQGTEVALPPVSRITPTVSDGDQQLHVPEGLPSPRNSSSAVTPHKEILDQSASLSSPSTSKPPGRKVRKRSLLRPRKFSDGNSSNAHSERRVSTREKPHDCPYCTKKFPTALRLKVHLRSHTGWESNECSLCWQAFPSRSDLKEHARTHTAAKLHGCCHCPKRFQQEASLREHLKTHTV